MKLTIIGYWGGYPKANEASAGYLLEHDGFHLLLDCGSAVLSKLQTFIEPEQLDAVIISHYHADHISDIGTLQHARLIQGILGKKMDCLPIYGHTFNKEEFAKLTFKEITRGVNFLERETMQIGPFSVRFMKTNHPVECFAMRMEAGGRSIVYTGDTSFKEEFIPFTKNADLLLCECNFYADQDSMGAGHMRSIDGGRLANEANVKHLVLTHLPHYGNIEQLKEEAATIYKGTITLVHSGLSLTI